MDRVSDGKRRSDTARLAKLAGRQHDTFAVWQLAGIGVARRAVQRRARAGHLRRVHRGVYRLGSSKLTSRARSMAAVLAFGADALLSHGFAAALWGLQAFPSRPVDVTASRDRLCEGVRGHRARNLTAADRTVIDGIPVTSLERTLLDIAPEVSHQRLRTLMEAAQRRDLLHPERILDVAQRNRGHRGAGKLGAVLAELHDEAPWTQSELERRFLELIRSAGLPEPQGNVVVAGHVVDFYWPGQRLVVEVDGYEFHRGRRSFEEDRRRDIALALAGVRSVRVTQRRIVHDGRRLVLELAGLLGCRTP